MRDAVYLSPHLDDAILSCGGFIRMQARGGLRPQVISCFAGVPDYHALSPFAAELHRYWGQPIHPVEQRRCEDATAMTYLGAEYQHWNYLDCIYRRHPESGEFLYASESAIFGELRNEEHSLIGQLVARLASTLPVDSVQIYAPLAVGHHVDHQLVFQVALQLRRYGYAVELYEDYPYAQDSESLARTLRAWAFPPLPKVRTLTEDNLGARIAAIHLYRSQLDVLFADKSCMAAQVRSYSLAVGGDRGYGERYWEGGQHLGPNGADAPRAWERE